MTHYEQGDILLINFNPSKGHEPAKKRPALVVSATRVNYMTNLILLVPITTTDNHFPLHVPISKGNVVEGFIQCEAARALDLSCRDDIKHLGSIDDETLSAVLEALGVVLGI